MYRFAGGLSIPEYDVKTQNKIDSIRKKFGISYFNTGCTVDVIDIEGQQKYKGNGKTLPRKKKW